MKEERRIAGISVTYSSLMISSFFIEDPARFSHDLGNVQSVRLVGQIMSYLGAQNNRGRNTGFSTT